MHKFLEACGLDGPMRLDLDGPSGPDCRALDQPFAVIGRSAGADLTLGDRRLSRRHAYLQAIAGEVFCVDLGSRAGVCWGHHRRHSGWVDRERGVVISPFRIRQGKDGGAAGISEGSDRPANPLAKLSADLTPPSRVVLEFSHAAVEQPTWTMNRLLTLVGSSPQCQVRLRDPGISRFHCSLLRTPTGVWAVDLLGRGGMVVNGASVRHRRIDDGDELQIGSIKIRFRCESPRVGNGSTVAIVPGIHEMGVASESWEVLPMPQQVRQQEMMFDQLQQAMTMLVRRFGDEHRDQMQVVREEIMQIRQLSGELQSLHSRLPTPPPHPPRVPSPRSSLATSPPLDAIDAAVPDPRSALLAPPGGAPADLPSTESGLSDPGPAPSGRAEGPPPLASGRPVEVGAAAVSSEDMHGLIRRRMEALEREQKSHWQRIVDLMRGPQTGHSGV